MGRKKALFCTTIDWHAPMKVGSHHLARCFRDAGWEVAFVSEPISPFHIFGKERQALKRRRNLHTSGGAQEKNLWAYVPFALLTPHNKPFLRGAWIAENWHKMTMPSVLEKVKKAGFEEVDLIYIDSLSGAFWLDAIKCQKSVFRVTDTHSLFPKFTQSLHRNEQRIAQHVDLVVYPSKDLEGYVTQLKPKRHELLSNCVHYDHFARGPFSKPAAYSSISGPIALYVGVMDEWFDFELVAYAATQLPHLSFVLIGPKHLAEKRLPKLPNIYLLGIIPFHQLPPYLAHANIGIMPFNVADYPRLVHGLNPLKLYEYLAAGIPVVSVSWNELKQMELPITAVETKEAFVASLQKNLTHRPAEKDLQTFAKQKDWSAAFQRLLDALENGHDLS